MLIIGAGFVIGSILGSFIYCLAIRSITSKPFWGRSYCLSCKKQLRWYDLFPVLSYLSTLGLCRYCKAKISSEYILIEVIFGFLIAFLFYQTFGLNDLSTIETLTSPNFYKTIHTLLELLFKIFIIGIFGVVFITDIKSGLIPDRITYPAIVITLLLILTMVVLRIYALYQSLSVNDLGKYLLPPHSDYFARHAFELASPLIGGVISGVGLGLFFMGLILITRGRGMGGGDFKLAIFMGLVLGFPGSILGIMLSFLLGSIFSVGLIIFGKKKLGQTIPFGPFMTLGGLITLFWGSQILDWYLSLNRS